jgi:hypothetical protein
MTVIEWSWLASVLDRVEIERLPCSVVNIAAVTVTLHISEAHWSRRS